MKLIRLATDNDGVFASAFQNDMIIAKESQMALLNLTFQTNYDVLAINDSNNKITFKSNILVAGTGATSELNQVIYNTADYKDFFTDLTYNLNKAIADADHENCMSTQWVVGNFSDMKTLEFRYAPWFNPLNMIRRVEKFIINWKLMSYNINKFSVVTGDSPTFKTTIKKKTGDPATNDRTCAMTTYGKMSVGNGILVIRPRKSVDNGSGLQDNGFGIGLSKSNLRDPKIYQEGDDIPADKRNFEIRYNRPTENYVFIDDNSVEQDSNIPPVNPNGEGANDGDLIYFKVQDGKVEGGVLQMGTKGYVNLTTGNDWTQSPTPATEIFDELNLGQIARYRRTQVGTALQHWWEPTSATDWNVYTGTTPPVIGQTPDATATINVTTGVITIGGTIFTPAQVPSVVTRSDGGVGGGGYRRAFFSVDLKVGEELYPYLYLRGTNEHIEVDTFNYSIDPWINQDYELDSSAENPKEGNSLEEAGWPITGLDAEGNETNAWANGINSIYTGDNLFSGSSSNAFPLPTPVSWGETKTMELTLHSDIWKFLGFTDIGYGDVTQALKIGIRPAGLQYVCWTAYYGNKEVLPANSDNYLVESMSLPLDSFDASKIQYQEVNSNGFKNPATDKRGRRKNILMTIPVNDNGDNNIVEYEASTPIFIDINNADEINAKNLNFRILNKNFDSIKQSGETAIMTILIKNPTE